MVRAGFATAVAGLAVAVFGSAPYLLMVLLTPGDEAPDDFDGLMRVGLALGGALGAGGLLAAALGAVFPRPPQRAARKP
jgi:hypothetical protein